MVFGELVPKNLAIARPYFTGVWFAIPLQVVNRVLRQLILFLNESANWTVRKLGIEPREELAGVRSMEELELMIRSSGEEGRLDDDEMELLTRAITFTEKVAADAMVPRVSVVGLSRHDSVAELRRTSAATGHSRFPVFDEDLDDIVGVVHVKDSFNVPESRIPLTPVGRADQHRPSRSLRRAHSNTCSPNSRQQGGAWRSSSTSTAGRPASSQSKTFSRRSSGRSRTNTTPSRMSESEKEEVEVLSGLLHRHEVEELIEFEWPEGRYETLGGFLVAELGRFPDVGEVIRVGDTSFEVLSMDGHRVDQVRVTRYSDREGDDG